MMARINVKVGVKAVLCTEEMPNPVLALIYKDLVQPIIAIPAQDSELCYKVPPVGEMLGSKDM
jgi:hypothetical protein